MTNGINVSPLNDVGSEDNVHSILRCLKAREYVILYTYTINTMVCASVLYVRTDLTDRYHTHTPHEYCTHTAVNNAYTLCLCKIEAIVQYYNHWIRGCDAMPLQICSNCENFKLANFSAMQYTPCQG